MAYLKLKKLLDAIAANAHASLIVCAWRYNL